MILYIYKIKNMDLKIDDFNKIQGINIKNHENNYILGEILPDAVEFIYCINSKFLFIITEKRSLKRKVFKLFYESFNGNISLFSTPLERERKMICDSDYKNIKFIHDNELVYSNKLNKDYCNNTVEDEYYFFEAELHFLKNGIEYKFIYYRDCIKIKRNYEKDLFEIVNIFEEYMDE